MPVEMLVTVVIPTYNRRDSVVDAVGSVLQQQGVALELIVVDDGSTDGTVERLRQQRDSRLRVIATDNRGVAAARNLGVRAGHGEWLAFLDSDDLWLPGKLAAQYGFLKGHPAVEICQTEEIWIRNGCRVNPRRHHRKSGGMIFEASLRLCLVSPSAVMLRRTLFDRVGGFDESFPACEDYDLWLRIGRDTAIELIDEPLVVRHGGHADQLSRRHWGMDRFRVASIARLLDAGGLSREQRVAAIRVLQEKCRILAAGARRRGRDDEAGRYLELARHYELRAGSASSPSGRRLR